MSNENFGFEELELWKKVREFKKEVSKEAIGFPAEEKFRLTDQIIRSSRSVNALISEGHGRLPIPSDSLLHSGKRIELAETINHLIDAFDDGYITEEKLIYYKTKGKEIERLLNGYLSYLRKKRDEQKKRGNADL